MTEYNYEYYLKRVEDGGWGFVNEDDKYYEDNELEDSFMCFYVYTFAHLNLPAPTRAQLEMAHFISSNTAPHKMIMAMRGLA